MSFHSLGLAEPLVRALEAKGYTQPTPIQSQAIPIVSQGRDLLGIAQTGTGKTAAFVLPSLQRMAAAPKRVLPTQCRMLVLAPTRELASQIADEARRYGQFSQLTVVTVFGGTSLHKNREEMSRGAEILVATPGRLIDLVERGDVNLSNIEILVLDEADQMLDLGFVHSLRRIVKMVPPKRQTLFFSATMPNSIRELAGQFLTDPRGAVTVSVAPAATTAERVEQTVTFVDQTQKQALLTIVLRDPSIDRALVFTRTKHGANKVVKLLGGNGIQANAIHGNKSQPQREAALAAFKSGEAPVLIATDIAARGIDVSGVSHVINFDLPNVPEQYVHRIGRTARAGASGIATAFCAEDERPFLKDIEKVTRQQIPVVPLPDDFAQQVAQITAARAQAIGADPPPREERSRQQQRGQGKPRGAQGGAAAAASSSGQPAGARREKQPRQQQSSNKRRATDSPAEPAYGPGSASGSMPMNGGGGGGAPAPRSRQPRGAPQGRMPPSSDIGSLAARLEPHGHGHGHGNGDAQVSRRKLNNSGAGGGSAAGSGSGGGAGAGGAGRGRGRRGGAGRRQDAGAGAGAPAPAGP